MKQEAARIKQQKEREKLEKMKYNINCSNAIEIVVYRKMMEAQKIQEKMRQENVDQLLTVQNTTIIMA